MDVVNKIDVEIDAEFIQSKKHITYTMRLNASSLQLFACFTGCAFLFAGRFVSVAWARLGYALTPHLVRLVFRCA